MNQDWENDLLLEKSLGEVYLATKRFPKSSANRTIYMIVAVVSLYIVFSWFCLNRVAASAETTLNVADICLDISVAILGFLITGFAIFVGLSRDPIMILLAKINMPGRDISIFKDIFFNFLSVFYIYLRVLSIAVVVKIGSTVGLEDGFAEYGRKTMQVVFLIINSAVFILLTSNLAFALVRLKSFIWNIYRSYLTIVITRSKVPNDEKLGS